MEIPFGLSIFSWIYEVGRWIVLALLLAGLLCSFILPLWRKPVLLLFCVIFPLVFGALNFCVTWCGFHYRMELRDRWGKYRGNVNIDLMPPNIRREYAKHDYHPRERNVKGAVIQIPVLAVVMLLFSGVTWCVILVMDGITKTIRRIKDDRRDRV